MASELFNELKARLSLSGLNIDSWTYKCYSRASVGIFWAAAVCSVASSLIGSAIECKGDIDAYGKDYCWLHGAKHLTPNQISKEIHNGDDCFAFDDNPEKKATNYYIWVSLVLFLSGAAFALPNEVWKHMEGGMIEQFGKDRENFLEEPEKKAQIFRKITNNETKRYFFTFVIFEWINYIVGVLVFVVTDKFLSGKFSSYGLDTLAYLMGNGREEEINRGDKTVPEKVNPMCNLFPTVVNCDLSLYGVGKGSEDTRSYLCLMKQNIMNQKIYLVLWIWLVFLLGLSLFMFLYRIAILILPDFRRLALLRYMKTSQSSAVNRLSLDFEHIGNWFLLIQIGKNTNPYKLREFLREAKNAEHSRTNTDPKTRKFETISNGDIGGNNHANEEIQLMPIA